MPRRAPTEDTVDPVRSRLAASVATPAPRTAPRPAQAPTPMPEPAEAPAPAPDPTPEPPAAVGGVPEPEPRHVQRRVPPPVRRPAPQPPARKDAMSAMRITKKFLVNENESDRMEATLAAIGDAFGSRVTYSQASRAVWSLLAIAEEALAAHPRRGEPLRRPSKGDAIGMAEYEEELSDYLRTVLKRM
ncbi:MAG: hypothetical protein CMK32_03025 [Porticoccaceae bacterium]|nr:hypothetical protein [Porticoccaceae bacterium]